MNGLHRSAILRPLRPSLLAASVGLVLGGLACCPSTRGDEAFSLEKPALPPHDARFQITKMVEKPVLTRGERPDDWDHVDVLNPSIVRVGGLYFSYYSGFNGKLWQTGLATSPDGITWTKDPHNPILGPGPGKPARRDIAANGDAIVINDQVHYYFVGRDDAGVATIGQATSADGRTFRMFAPKPVIDVGPKGSWDDTAVGDPNIIAHRGGYYLYYLGMNSVGVQRLGVAHSVDGNTWEKSAGNPILDPGPAHSFDENGVGEPAVFFQAPYFYMLYTGRDSTEQRNLGLAVSRDGVNWRKTSPAGLVAPDLQQAWDKKVVCDPSVIPDVHGGLMVYFGGGDLPGPADNVHGNIGVFYATVGTNRTVFDAGGDWSGENSTEVLVGSYPIESSETGKFVWVGPDAEITLATGGGRNLRLTGWVPIALYHERNGLDSFSVTVSANGQPVGEIKVASGQDSLVNTTFDLSAVPPPENGAITIKLHSSSSLAPTDRDRREVSFVINRIELQ